MTIKTPSLTDLSTEAQDFYCRSMRILAKHQLPYLVGGAYALTHYTGVVRHTKDFDIFVRPDDCRRVLDAFAAAGYPTDLTFAHWLGKIFHGEEFIDVIFSSGNGVVKVDDEWFEHAQSAAFLGEPVRVVPVEEMIWSKAYVCERERYDGADINHLLRARGHTLDWPRLLRRFGPHWRLLLSHLVLFGFAYPAERDQVPAEVMDELLGRLRQEPGAASDKVCQGTLLSRVQYLIDLQEWGYRDARLDAEAGMSARQAWAWTEAGLK
jgi:hypothetical protein